VTDSWEEFKQNYYDSINNVKSKLNITIYGSYYPDEDKSLLRDLKRILKEKGYPNTFLVEDKQSKEDDPLEISQLCMLYSDINLLIFTHTGKRLGLVDELSFLTSDPRMSQKIDFSLAFDQLYERQGQERTSIPDLSMSRVKRYGVQRRKFSTSEELKEIIVKEIYWLMIRWADRYDRSIFFDSLSSSQSPLTANSSTLENRVSSPNPEAVCLSRCFVECLIMFSKI
jgi:hypothetical protein